LCRSPTWRCRPARVGSCASPRRTGADGDRCGSEAPGTDRGPARHRMSPLRLPRALCCKPDVVRQWAAAGAPRCGRPSSRCFRGEVLITLHGSTRIIARHQTCWINARHLQHQASGSGLRRGGRSRVASGCRGVRPDAEVRPSLTRNRGVTADGRVAIPSRPSAVTVTPGCRC
jgi:hypothetical protein